jgi:ribose transport system substrate-binding protein
MSDPTQTVERPKRLNLHWPVLITFIAALAVLWHYGVFKPKPKIALVTSGDTPYWDQVENGAKDAARVYDVKLTVFRAKSIPEAQTDLIRGLLDQGYDGIAISPINPQTQSGILAEVAAKTTLVTFDSDSPVARRLCFVGTDNYAAGRRAGDAVRLAIPDGGQVVICLGSLEKENTQHRRQGLIDELLDRPYKPDQPLDPLDQPLKGEKYTILATLSDNSEPNLAPDLVVKAIKENPDIKCFVGLLGYSAPAILSALEETGNTGKIKVIGFDNNDITLAAIERGTVFATILQDQYGCGFHTVRILAEVGRGDYSGLPKFMRSLPVEMVTKENIEGVAALVGRSTPTTSPAP